MAAASRRCTCGPSSSTSYARGLATDAVGPVFAGRDGESVSSRQVQRRFADALRRTGVRGRYCCHSLRYTFAPSHEAPSGPASTALVEIHARGPGQLGSAPLVAARARARGAARRARRLRAARSSPRRRTPC